MLPCCLHLLLVFPVGSSLVLFGVASSDQGLLLLQMMELGHSAESGARVMNQPGTPHEALEHRRVIHRPETQHRDEGRTRVDTESPEQIGYAREEEQESHLDSDSPEPSNASGSSHYHENK